MEFGANLFYDAKADQCASNGTKISIFPSLSWFRSFEIIEVIHWN